jgi:hypothetical protein
MGAAVALPGTVESAPVAGAEAGGFAAGETEDVVGLAADGDAVAAEESTPALVPLGLGAATAAGDCAGVAAVSAGG